jgi:hypothetical protein
MTVKKYAIFIGLIFFAISCSKKELTPAEYISWVNDKSNGLIVEKIVGDYSFRLFYKPLPYVSLKELSGKFSNSDYAAQINEMSEFQYYTLEISAISKKEDVLKKGNKTKNDYYSKIQYFSFAMQNDLSLKQENEILACKLFQYERDYNLSPYQRFILGFPLSALKNSNADRTLIYDDKVLGIDEPVAITIKARNISSIPKLLTKD